MSRLTQDTWPDQEDTDAASETNYSEDEDESYIEIHDEAHLASANKALDNSENDKLWADFSGFDLKSPAARKLRKKLREYAIRKRGFEAYERQLEIAIAIALGFDVLCSVRTGAGKSLVYQMLTSLGKKEDGIMILIFPLTALIEEQTKVFNDMGVPAIGLTSDSLEGHGDKVWHDLHKGAYRVVITSPEHLLEEGSPFWHTLCNGDLKRHPFLSKLVGIVVNEAHVIYKWGESGFRLMYRHIGRLRAHFPKAPFLLLSATMTPPVRAYVHKVIGLAKPAWLFKSEMFRKNLRLIVAPLNFNPAQAKHPSSYGLRFQKTKTKSISPQRR